MHARKPLVATDKLGLPEVVVEEETGLLAPEGNARAYAQAVIRLVDDRALRLRLGQGGYDLVTRRHSLSAMIASFEALYENRLDQHDMDDPSSAPALRGSHGDGAPPVNGTGR